jgi:membrane-bound lytic murein transglycosylase B
MPAVSAAPASEVPTASMSSQPVGPGGTVPSSTATPAAGDTTTEAPAPAIAPSVVPLVTTAPAAAAEPPPGSRFTAQELEPLLKRLEADGFDRAMLNRVFYDVRIHRVDRVITYNVFNPDSAKIYEQFLAPFAINLAKTFHKNHQRELAELRVRTSVSPEVIVGILLVETQFGTAALRYHLIEVFTTLIVDASPEAVERHYRRLKADAPDLDRGWVEARLQKKAVWAYDELKALLNIRDRIGVDSLYEVKGSYAGAFGMPQFMPSSYAQWAVDGNHDRRVDLDNPADAMASIANFLVQHGWARDATLEQKMRAVWEYNHSMHYVRTIFGIAVGMQRPSAKHGHALSDAAPETGTGTDLDAKRIEDTAAMMAATPRLGGPSNGTPASPMSGPLPSVPTTPIPPETDGLPPIIEHGTLPVM